MDSHQNSSMSHSTANLVDHSAAAASRQLSKQRSNDKFKVVRPQSKKSSSKRFTVHESIKISSLHGVGSNPSSPHMHHIKMKESRPSSSSQLKLKKSPKNSQYISEVVQHKTKQSSQKSSNKTSSLHSSRRVSKQLRDNDGALDTAAVVSQVAETNQTPEFEKQRKQVQASLFHLQARQKQQSRGGFNKPDDHHDHDHKKRKQKRQSVDYKVKLFTTDANDQNLMLDREMAFSDDGGNRPTSVNMHHGQLYKPKKLIIKPSTTFTDMSEEKMKPLTPVDVRNFQRKTHNLLSNNDMQGSSGVYQQMASNVHGSSEQRYYEVSDNLSKHRAQTVEVDVSHDDGRNLQTDSIYQSEKMDSFQLKKVRDKLDQANYKLKVSLEHRNSIEPNSGLTSLNASSKLISQHNEYSQQEVYVADEEKGEARMRTKLIKTESSSMKKARRPASKNHGESHQILPIQIHKDDEHYLRSSLGDISQSELRFGSQHLSRHVSSQQAIKVTPSLQSQFHESQANEEYQTAYTGQQRKSSCKVNRPPKQITVNSLKSRSSNNSLPKKAVKISMFEQFVKKSIKQDLFNLTYHDEVFARMLRDFIPKSDFFIKPERACSPIAIGDDGSVYTSWKKPENRKKRKSQKLEFLTTLLDSMMASIYEFSGKLQLQHEQELEKVRQQVTEEQNRLQKKLFKIQQNVSEVTHGAQHHTTSLEHEWENLVKEKQTFKEQVDKFMRDRDQLEKDIIEFRNCKQAQELAHRQVVDDFKRMQASIVQELEHREYQLQRKEKQTRTFESDLYRREKQLTDLIMKNERFDQALSGKYFSPEDTAILSNFLPASGSLQSSACGIDFTKSGANFLENYTAQQAAGTAINNSRSTNIDQLLNQFQEHQADMIKREVELQNYLSKKEESIRDKVRDTEIQASLEQLLDDQKSASARQQTNETVRSKLSSNSH